MVEQTRTFTYLKGVSKKGPVIYWMSRDQRVHDNWAFLFATQQAKLFKASVMVVFALDNSFPGANNRHYTFMIDGLKEVEGELCFMGVPFVLLMGNPQETLPTFLKQSDASLLVSDFDPLKVKQKWKNSINNEITIPHIEVDAHNIIPCRVASSKVEFGAYTLRPKINRLLGKYLVDFPELPSAIYPKTVAQTNWDKVFKWLNADESVPPVNWLKAGYGPGIKTLKLFIENGLKGYSQKRNDPNQNAQSNLSPYLHFGQISAQRVAIEITKADAPNEDKSAFLEELIVRRELSDNFCFNNPDYDNVNGFHPWAQETLNRHRNDEREHLYTIQEFESALTHDKLWNAAQKEMMITGKMHGYMRMYWAKKILEWTKSPEEAMQFAIYLNDKYSIDGRDPNGYTGIAWSIGGIHDRAWAERPVFGKIRFMNYNGCKRKFDVIAYENRWNNTK